MKFITVIAAATAMATSVPPLAIRDNEHPKLDVHLCQVDNSLVKAVVTNPNSEPLTLPNHNFFNSLALTKKVSVHCDGSEPEFHGVRLRHKTSDLNPDSFTTLKPGEFFEDTFDIAATTDMSEGGSVVVNSKGSVRYASDDGITIKGSIHYRSNDLEMNIDSHETSRVKRAIDVIQKRTTPMECSDERLHNCYRTRKLRNVGLQGC